MLQWFLKRMKHGYFVGIVVICCNYLIIFDVCSLCLAFHQLLPKSAGRTGQTRNSRVGDGFSQRIGSLGIFQDRGACDDLHAGSAQCDALRGTGAASTQGPNMTQGFSQDSFSATAIFPNLR